MFFRKDDIGITYCKPKRHVINFYCEGEMVHRVFESTSKHKIHIPMKDDWIEISEIEYEVVNRTFKYLDNRVVATVNLQKI